MKTYSHRTIIDTKVHSKIIYPFNIKIYLKCRHYLWIKENTKFYVYRTIFKSFNNIDTTLRDQFLINNTSKKI